VVAAGLPDGDPSLELLVESVLVASVSSFKNSHIHMIASDGLFLKNGLFYVMPSSIDLKPLEDIFQATILKMLKEEGKINDDIITNLLSWRHSGFSVDIPDKSFQMVR